MNAVPEAPASVNHYNRTVPKERIARSQDIMGLDKDAVDGCHEGLNGEIKGNSQRILRKAESKMAGVASHRKSCY
jgi:hypothetical protein